MFILEINVYAVLIRIRVMIRITVIVFELHLQLIRIIDRLLGYAKKLSPPRPSVESPTQSKSRSI